MTFDEERRDRPPRESVVPMINVVFLLLIFFLMSASVAPPDPVNVSLPSGPGSEVADGRAVLFLGSDGRPVFGDLRGAAAVAAAASAASGEIPLEIRADARLPATRLADVMSALGAAGAHDLRLVLTQK